MNDVAELKRFALAHARAQNIPAADYQAVIDRIHSDDAGEPGSWVGEWSLAAEALELEGKRLEACGYYNLARFPAVDGPARAEALKRCVEVCAAWAAKNGIRRIEAPVLGGVVPCWTVGLDSERPRPLLVVMGGIISIKEQWMSLLMQASALGMAVLVTELPGVGENSLTYTPDSWRLIPALLDHVAGEADVRHTYALCLSFSGHAALRAAVADQRIRGVVTIAAPIRGFFSDPVWRQGLPRVTVETLAALTGTSPAEITGDLSAWGITDHQLAGLDIPVHYVAVDEDEIIPREDLDALRRHVRRVRILEYHDQHAGPGNALETRIWILWSLLRIREVRSPRRMLLAAVAGALRLRRCLR